MQPPEFPKDFVSDHCRRVLDARTHRRLMGLPPDSDDDLEYAECAFSPRGWGLECDNCRKFICPIVPTNPADKHFDVIQQFYREYEAYDKARDLAEMNRGAWI